VNLIEMEGRTMRQQTLANGSFEKFRKKTLKELFQDDMEQFIPWQERCGANEPCYPKPEAAGRRPGIQGNIFNSIWVTDAKA
jgi:hypothetical protein